ncbi:MFS transporter [Clostridium sp. 3-3]|nr:MFS transporter [Clostridium butyricum]MZI79957.1 MFS transporter [Clostridium butyricum]POO86614.1 MFS transporter [Clostridium sp. 3-3]QUF85071.1 MFS transporter [Clostridium butyricum]
MENPSSLSYTKLISILGLAGFISAADNWFISPSLSAIASEFNVSSSIAASILTAYLIPYGIMQPVFGFLSDRFSKTKILQFIVCGLALGTGGCSLSNSLEMLLVCRAFTGFFAAGIIAVSLALIGDTVKASDRQIYVGRFLGIIFLGQGLSSGLGGILTKYFSWRVSLVFFTIASILTVFLLHKLPYVFPVPIHHKFLPEIKRVIFTPKGKVIFPLALLTGFLLIGLYSFLGSFLHDVLGLDYLQVGTVIMFYGFACLIAGSQVGKLEQKLGKKATLLLGSCFSLCTILLLMIFSCWQAVWIATISLGFGYIFIQSTLATSCFDIASESKGLPSGIIGLCLFGGAGLGTAFNGWLLSELDYKSLWLIVTLEIIIFVLIISKLNYNKI